MKNNIFEGKTAIITGGASGIGRAVGAEMVRRGARVVLADIDGDRAKQAAAEMASSDGDADSARLDVTDAAATRDLVREVAASHGRLDYMFNNAGVSMVSEVRDMTLDDWRRMIDVNLLGVIHGVLAAYPVMIEQGHGHIINTASIGGLSPFVLAAGYVATKHAVVGLSTSLRCEAKWLGVKVSVVCPGFIDTPLKDTLTYRNIDKETAINALPFALHSAERCALDIVHGVLRNKAIIVVTPQAKALWWLFRTSPGLYLWANSLAAKRLRSLRREGKI